MVSQRLIAALGGIYISLAGRQHEGRGLGPEIKEAIYQLREDEGLDTVEATVRLGVEEDVRRYGHVARHLARTLQLKRACLLGNNPLKKHALEAEGIEVSTLNLVMSRNDATTEYLQVKAAKLGHDIDVMSTTVFVFNEDGSMQVLRGPRRSADVPEIEWHLPVRGGTIIKS
jgi:3,4-dihydroxy 2-butanone 4-phosphate synthase/GTP cyclohydrolase II